MTGGFPPEAYSAMHKTWHGDGKLTEEECWAVVDMHKLNSLDEPNINIYLKRPLRNAYKKYIKQG